MFPSGVVNVTEGIPLHRKKDSGVARTRVEGALARLRMPLTSVWAFPDRMSYRSLKWVRGSRLLPGAQAFVIFCFFLIGPLFKGWNGNG